MAERLTGAELIRRVDRSMTKAMFASNIVGSLIVFVFLTLLLPVRHPPPVREVMLWNVPAVVVFGAIVSIVAPRWGRAIVFPRLEWLREERAPTPREQRRALRNPLAQMRMVCALWSAGAIAFGLINLHFSPHIGGSVAEGIVMGGLVTGAISYLLAERVARPITARALEYGVPLRPVTPGVVTRTILAWALATGVPVVGIIDMASAELTGEIPRNNVTALAILFLAAVTIAAGALAILVVAKSVADPIRSVRYGLAQVEEGRVDVAVEVDDAGEVGLLQAGFNRMAAGLREREELRDLFGRHVGEDVARRALAEGVELGGEIREAAVLFVDVVGSTRLAATTPPQEVVARLNEFFKIVLEVVADHGGWVNKFEGDAAVCIFGVPTPLDDPAGCALAAARALCTRLEDESPLQAGIGVSAGEVLAGNIGALERLEYTVIGDAVNEAARLTEVAKSLTPRVVAAGRAVARAGAEEAARWEGAGEVTLRGRTEPTALAAPAAHEPSRSRASDSSLERASR